ncbi:MAG: class I SAM-dependent methyltransferase [Armatimonadetes bacterium]|nr:class I SAM-dependent methyltransferase [Armatimonadota bacterium]
MDQKLDVVRGRRVLKISGREFRQAALAASRVVIDMGTGDGRWIYRLARAYPDWCCIGIDASAEAMRESSWRAARKPARGGASNAWFVRTAVEAPPSALCGLADAIHVQFPWGSLRRVLLQPDPGGLSHLACIGKPGAAFYFTMNVLPEDQEAPGRDRRLVAAYARAGLIVERSNLRRASPQTSWGKRLGSGRAAPVLVIEGRIADRHEIRAGAQWTVGESSV